MYFKINILRFYSNCVFWRQFELSLSYLTGKKQKTKHLICRLLNSCGDAEAHEFKGFSRSVNMGGKVPDKVHFWIFFFFFFF